MLEHQAAAHRGEHTPPEFHCKVVKKVGGMEGGASSSGGEEQEEPEGGEEDVEDAGGV